jgi:hypothetical protein
MYGTNGSLPSPTCRGEIIVSSPSLATIDLNQDDPVNMIELDDSSENCTADDAAMELTPYPYLPTSEELADYYQLERSLGEDWSLRLACELSSDAISMDDSDHEEFECESDDSVTFFDDSNHHINKKLTVTLPEDIEVRSYTRKETFFDEAVTPIECCDIYESL